MSEQDICQQVRHHASRWADGHLGAATSDAVETHLARCDACRIEFAAIRNIFTPRVELVRETIVVVVGAVVAWGEVACSRLAYETALASKRRR